MARKAQGAIVIVADSAIQVGSTVILPGIETEITADELAAIKENGFENKICVK